MAWNLLWLRPGQVGGSEEYATRQLRALAHHAVDEVRVTAFVLDDFRDHHPDLFSQIECIALPRGGHNRAGRVLAESSWLAARTRRGFDLVHHLGGRIPAIASRPRVLTIHDLQPLDAPENFSMVKQRFLARALPRSAKRADAVVTVSSHVRAQVIERFGIEARRVRAIPAPLPVMAQGDDTAASGNIPPMLAELLASRAPFFVYPAITYPHKNHRVLLEAFARLRLDHPEARLVLCGGAAGEESAVLERAGAPDLAGSVLRTGRVPRQAIDALFAQAVGVAFPSRFEGFGLPVLEARSVGCPVIAADIAALREVGGDRAVFVDPEDVSGWTAAMAKTLVRAQHGGVRQAEADLLGHRFRPEVVSATLVQLYREVLSAW